MPRGAVLLMILLVPALGRSADVPRPEHPRPESVRPHWSNLNGTWQFRFDPADKAWRQTGSIPPPRDSTVKSSCPSPGRANSPVSATPPATPRSAGTPRPLRFLPPFPAITASSSASRPSTGRPRSGSTASLQQWRRIEGGYSPFSLDITDEVNRDGENTLVVRAFDPTDRSLPTGKQVGWYTTTSGIWQTVWLESQPQAHLDAFTFDPRYRPDPGRGLGEPRRTSKDQDTNWRRP